MVTKEEAVEFITQLVTDPAYAHRFPTSNLDGTVEYYANELVTLFAGKIDIPLFEVFPDGWEELADMRVTDPLVLDEFAAQNFDAQAYADKNASTNTLNRVEGNDWKPGFQQALANLLITRGMAVSLQPSFYGWMDDDYNDPRRNRESIIYISEVKEVYYDQFVGTFEGDKVEYALEATAIYASGFSRRLRLVGTLSSVLHELLK